MPREELEIEIGPDGQVQVHVKGLKGKKCLEYKKVFSELLGPVKETKLTDEYYEEEVQVKTRKEIRGRTR